MSTIIEVTMICDSCGGGIEGDTVEEVKKYSQAYGWIEFLCWAICRACQSDMATLAAHFDNVHNAGAK